MNPSAAKRERITAFIVSRIASGEWPAGARIASENELAEMFAVSRMTAHYALRDLAVRGLITRHNGSGTFVAQPKAYVAQYDHLDVIEEIRARGGVHNAKIVKRALAPATAEQGAMLDVGPGEVLFHAIIVHLEDGVALELEDRLVNPMLLPACLDVDLGRCTLFSLLMRTRPSRQGSETIRAVRCSAAEQKLLGIKASDPCLEVVRKTWTPEHVVTRARMLRPGQRTEITGRITVASE